MKKQHLKKLSLVFPKNNRIISEHIVLLKQALYSGKAVLIQRFKIIFFVLFGIFIVLPLVILTVLTMINLKNDQQKKDIAMVERQKVMNEIVYWQHVADTHKDYRDAYFALASLEYQVKDFSKAWVYIQKCLTLDPNYQQGRNLEKIISEKL